MVSAVRLERPITIDSRERQPWFRSPVDGFTFETCRRTMATGDYSLDGLEGRVLIERKNGIDELVSCIVAERERFVAELERMRDSCRSPHLIVEACWQEIELGQYRARIAPQAVVGSLLAWADRYGVRCWFVGGRQAAERVALRLLAGVERDEARRLVGVLARFG